MLSLARLSIHVFAQHFDMLSVTLRVKETELFLIDITLTIIHIHVIVFFQCAILWSTSDV